MTETKSHLLIEGLQTNAELLIYRQGHSENVIKLFTYDNPGWGLDVRVHDSTLMQSFRQQKLDRTDEDWVYSVIEDDTICVAGGPANLVEIIINYVAWAESFSDHELSVQLAEDSIFRRLERWYVDICRRDAYNEGIEGVEIRTVAGPGWHAKINLLDTYLDGKSFSPISDRKSENDWFDCQIVEDDFIAKCSLRRLGEVLDIFLSWAGF